MHAGQAWDISRFMQMSDDQTTAAPFQRCLWTQGVCLENDVPMVWNCTITFREGMRIDALWATMPCRRSDMAAASSGLDSKTTY
jgi:hypothetical protein